MATMKLDDILAKYKFNFSLKKEQTDVIELICIKNDVFALLPTGFGKSLTYTMIPLYLDEVMYAVH